MKQVKRSYNIDSLQGVEEFLSDLTNLYECVYHPDDDISFTEFKDRDLTVTFSKGDGLYLDSVMSQCIEFCDKNNLDICEIGLKCVEEFFEQRKVEVDNK